VINPAQFALELILVVAALLLSRSLTARRHCGFVTSFALATAAVTALFYYVAVGPLYLARGLDRAVVVGSVAYETIRWGVLAYVLSRLAVRLQHHEWTTGFAVLRSGANYGRVLGVGVAAGVLVVATIYALAFVEQHLGYIDALPWPVANGEPVDVTFAVGGGLRNLFGEEILTRLGAQSIASYLLRGVRGGPVLALILSSLYFEIWHNPFEVPQMLNFAASFILGWTYQKHGYESAAVGHCVANWISLGVLPPLLFGRA
jgi:hypothetical protein